MRNWMIGWCVGACLTIALPGMAAAATPCRVENAQYRLDLGSGFTAGFKKVGHYDGWVSDLALYVRSDATGAKYWFLFDEGAAPRVTLISTTDVETSGWSPPDPDGGERPLSETLYLQADAHDHFAENGPPQGGQVAPDKLLLPDLPAVIRGALTPEEAIGHGFFQYKACLK